MADKNVTLTENNGADNLFPATKIGQVQGGGDLFEATKLKGLGDAGQILMVNQQENDVEWVTPYDASTAVISPTVTQGDQNPVSGDAVYNALGQANISNPINTNTLDDIEPGLYSVDVSGMSFPTGFSLLQTVFLVSLEDPEADIDNAIKCIMDKEEFAVNHTTGTINHTFSIGFYYGCSNGDPTERMIGIDLWMDGSQLAYHRSSSVAGVKITRIIKYI